MLTENLCSLRRFVGRPGFRCGYAALWGRRFRPMPLSFPKTAQSAFLVGRTPWSAADAHVGLLGLDESDFTGEERVQGDPRRPGGLPHDCIWIPGFGKTK